MISKREARWRVPRKLKKSSKTNRVLSDKLAHMEVKGRKMYPLMKKLDLSHDLKCFGWFDNL